MNRTFLAITLAFGFVLIWIPTQITAFQSVFATTAGPQDSVQTADAPASPFGLANGNYRAEVVRVNRMNSALTEATQQLKEAESSKDKEEATDAIRTELGKQYDQFLEANEQQIEQLQERLDKLRDQLVRRRDAKEKMVDLELERVVNESEGLIWPNSNVRGALQSFPGFDVESGNLNWLPGVSVSPPNPPSAPAAVLSRQRSKTTRLRSAK